jgi:hypothetical protein
VTTWAQRWPVGGLGDFGDRPARKVQYSNSSLSVGGGHKRSALSCTFRAPTCTVWPMGRIGVHGFQATPPLFYRPLLATICASHGECCFPSRFPMRWLALALVLFWRALVSAEPAGAGKTTVRLAARSCYACIPCSAEPSGVHQGGVTEADIESVLEAAHKGNGAEVRAMVERLPPLATAHDENRWTALHKAALEGRKSPTHVSLFCTPY